MKKIFKKINSKIPPNREGGAAMLLSVIFFLFISLAIVFGLVSPSVRGFKTATDQLLSKQSYFLSESGVEDAYFRLKTPKPIGTSTSITLAGNTVTTTIADSGYNQKTVISQGDVSSRQRKSKIVLLAGAGVGFNYGLQSGEGGMDISGGSTIDGSAYSTANVKGVSATVTGSAVAADSPPLGLDQSNDTPATPASSINFRNVAASQDFAQSFQIGSTALVNKVQFYIKKVGAPSDATIRVVADNGGTPSTTLLPTGAATLSSASVTTSFSWVEVIFPTNPSLIPGATYWLVIDDSTQNASNYYVLGANADSSYLAGTAKVGTYSGAWTSSSLDGYFKIYTGGITSLVGGASYAGAFLLGSGGTGDAWATTVKGTSAQGNMYCTTGTNNNKACNTTHGSVPILGLPLTEENVTDWKNTAEAGGTISGNVAITSTGGSLGPKKITGNLTIGGGGTLTITGTLWVVGSVTVSGGGKMKLPASYALNSETIVSDNLVSIAGGGSVGSGAPGSYLFIVTTSRCPYDIYCSGTNAIVVSGGAGTIAVYAQKGTVLLNGGASLSAATGHGMIISGGAHVIYDIGLASPSFSNGPSGGWNISDWGETK